MKLIYGKFQIHRDKCREEQRKKEAYELIRDQFRGYMKKLSGPVKNRLKASIGSTKEKLMYSALFDHEVNAKN